MDDFDKQDIATRLEWLAGKHAVYDGEWHKEAITTLRSRAAEIERLTAALSDAERRGYDAARMQAAEIVLDNQETVSNVRGRYLSPRPHGDFLGSAYAAAIIAMEPK